jgi:hypothetical protein
LSRTRPEEISRHSVRRKRPNEQRPTTQPKWKIFRPPKAPKPAAHSFPSLRDTCFSLSPNGLSRNRPRQCSFGSLLHLMPEPIHPPPFSSFPVLSFTFFALTFQCSLSSFVRTTCSLSVSWPYLALRTFYPARLRSTPNERDSSKQRTLRPTPRNSHRTITFSGPFFQTSYRRAKLLCPLLPHSTILVAEISILCSAEFNRLYYRHHGCFLFLAIMICLSSCRNPWKQEGGKDECGGVGGRERDP